jgi:transcriptional regulator with XRE-family HTH domain
MTRIGQLDAEQSAIVGSNARLLRLRAGWTQARIGTLLDTHVTRISRLERGEYRFTRLEVRELAEIFGVATADLLAECLNCHGRPQPGLGCFACGAVMARGSGEQ